MYLVNLLFFVTIHTKSFTNVKLKVNTYFWQNSQQKV